MTSSLPTVPPSDLPPAHLTRSREPSASNPERIWRWMAGGFFLFIVVVVASADLGAPLPILDWVVYLPGRDFTGHVILIGGLGFLVNGALDARRARLGGPLLGSWWVGCGILLEELSQIWLPSRAFSLSDLVANAVGLALADLAWRWLRHRSGADGAGLVWR